VFYFVVVRVDSWIEKKNDPRIHKEHKPPGLQLHHIL
jgi:hypothetical protein